MGGFMDYLSGMTGGADDSGAQTQGGAPPVAPPSQTLSRPHDGDSIGSQFLRALPYLAAGGAAAYMSSKNGGLGGGDAIASLTQGFLSDKLDQSMKKRDQQNQMDNFLIKAAYDKVDALSGKDLSGIKVPDALKNRLIELHQKANEARMNDGVVTAKEAQEIMALAGPIEMELQNLKTQQGEPTSQAVDKEEALRAGLNARDAALGNAPDTAYRQQAEAAQMVEVPGHPELGLMPKKEVAALIAKDAQLKQTQQKIDASIQNAIRTDSRVRARFAQGVTGSDTRAFNAALASLKSRISSAVNQAAAVNQVMPGTPAYDQLVDQVTQEQMQLENRAGGPAMQGKPPGPSPSRPNVRRVTRDASGNLVLGN